MDTSNYDIIHVGISGGKDSQAVATWIIQDSSISRDKIRLSFCDTGNEHEWTYEHVRRIQEWLGIDIEWLKNDLDFYQLAERKKRFPSAKARFCTQYLKMEVTQKHILGLMQQGLKVLLITGVRNDESVKRSRLLEFDFDTYYACDVWRPIISWTRHQVFEYLKSKGQFTNPLYSVGAQRVGCFPCIMSKKHEIRVIADKFPERIDMIRESENKIGASFYSRTYVPKRFRKHKFSRNDETWNIANIDDVVDWSHTAKGGKEYDSGPQLKMFEDEITCTESSGLCE